jgi:soluble P-type ATPase
VIHIEVPGAVPLDLTHAAIDFNGTLALDGQLLAGVAERLQALAALLTCHILTADTFGTAAEAVKGLGCSVVRVGTGAEKADWVRRTRGQVVAIGNGHNDRAMFEAAALSIGVIGPEGACGPAVLAADVVVTHVTDAFDLLLHPRRLTAVLRP